MTPSLFSQFFPWLNLHTSNRDVIVDASRGTRLTSHFHFSGDPRIEEEVIEKVASYGKQIGILSEAVLALAGEEGEKGEKVTRLKEMKDKIDDIKGTLKNPVFRRVLRVVDELLAGLYRHGSKMRVILYDSLCSVAVRSGL